MNTHIDLLDLFICFSGSFLYCNPAKDVKCNNYLFNYYYLSSIM